MIRGETATAHQLIGLPQAGWPSGWERLIRIINLTKGSQLFAEGDQLDFIFMVTSGEVFCYCSSSTGREVRERLAGPGELICPVTLVDGRPAPASVRASSNSQCLAIPARLARESLKTTTAFGRAVLNELCQCCRRLSSQVTLLSLEGAEQRVGWALWELCNLSGKSLSLPVMLTVTHGDLAAQVGTSREVVSRAISRLRQAGLIRTSRRCIVIPDAKVLNRFARQQS